MKKVLVTGANGHVGYNVVTELVQAGYQVRASVRDLNDQSKVGHLKPLGAELVRADLLMPDSLKSAVQGMDGVFQVAAVYRFYAKDPENEVIKPTVEGNMNLLEAAREEGIKKIILTSTVGAVGYQRRGGPPLTEEHWNDRAQVPYFAAKTKEERLAHEFAKQHGINLVAVNPGAVIGPGFHRHTDSTLMIQTVMDGKVPMGLPMIMGFVDARDVAVAHRLAYENEAAAGRYIAVGDQVSHLDFCSLIGKVDPGVKVPTKNMPELMLPLLPLLDWMAHKFQGSARSMTPAVIREFKGRDMIYDTSRIQHQLGWKPRPLEDTVRDSIQWIREKFR